jgi:hypothetical protein
MQSFQKVKIKIKNFNSQTMPMLRLGLFHAT